MKKLSIILLAIIFVLTGCSSMSEESSDTASVTPDNVINEEPTTVDSTDGSSDSDTTQEDNDVVDDNTNDEAVNPEDGSYNTGMYRVGIDIPAGDYAINVDENVKSGTYTVSNDMNAVDIITSGDVTSASSATITLEEGQYLILQHCNALIDTN